MKVDSKTKSYFKEIPWIDLSKYDQSSFDRGRPKWLIFIWWFLQGILFPISPHNFYFFRRWLLKIFGAKIGKEVKIRASVRILYPWKVEIGEYSWIGEKVYFNNLDKIKIGAHCVISQKTYLCTGSHDINDVKFGLIISPIKIHNGVWVATDCFIGPGVEIGANSIIGVRSSVFNSIPKEQIAWGTPCKPQHKRSKLKLKKMTNK